MKTVNGLVMAMAICGVLAASAIAHADDLDDNAKNLVKDLNNSASDSGANKVPPVGTIIDQILKRTNPVNDAVQDGATQEQQSSEGLSGSSDDSSNSASDSGNED